VANLLTKCFVFVCTRVCICFCNTSNALSVENGEPCFESIEIDNKHVPNSQITVSSGTTTQIPTNTNTIFTGWIHDATDLTPWILVCIINVKVFSHKRNKTIMH
jgi:hypothetical protein